MPYRPRGFSTGIFTADEQDRSFAYVALWAGLPACIVLLASLHFGKIAVLTPVCSGMVVGSLIGLVLSWSNDEFVRTQIAFAANWALTFAGIILLFEVVPSLNDRAPDQRWTLAIMATIFHAALAWRRWRDR
ncbi:hypothetical protein OIK40_01200 [Erythrobacter sp. sf7]|uniref:Uncharacterized protein n=1 Tax=Erythrobacter fulvus TaxID=2987523 RepID=A0ABT5JM95_9SPHN|nr:hypothetical protein [Erythrobacter fulvus]MDC8753253.1 hypothetical protein [Erythrobacter fulvus]